MDALASEGQCWNVDPSPEHLPTLISHWAESLEDCEGRGPGSGHVVMACFNGTCAGLGHGGCFHLALGSFLIAHPSPHDPASQANFSSGKVINLWAVVHSFYPASLPQNLQPLMWDPVRTGPAVQSLCHCERASASYRPVNKRVSDRGD